MKTTIITAALALALAAGLLFWGPSHALAHTTAGHSGTFQVFEGADGSDRDPSDDRDGDNQPPRDHVEKVREIAQRAAEAYKRSEEATENREEIVEVGENRREVIERYGGISAEDNREFSEEATEIAHEDSEDAGEAIAEALRDHFPDPNYDAIQVGLNVILVIFAAARLFIRF